ncbi:MAG: hypothetical protein HN849_00110, partial [Victivallales bacterium]|nr:hypothetical protein [Victivallales bacterium]
MRLPGLLWTLISIFAVTAAQAQLVKNPRAGVLWEDTFDELELNESRHGGWGGLKEPPSASLTVKDGVLTMRETGESSYWPVQRYIPYD